MERREMMKILTALPLTGWALSHAEVADAAEAVDELLHQPPTQNAPSQQPPIAKPVANANVYKPMWFGALEYRTVRVLADMVIPRDARSGSASDAGVPQFMDFVMQEYPNNQARMRDGLGWINAESRKRYGVPFPDATVEQRRELVEEIAWPAKAKPEMAAGVRFFNSFRDLTASGFFTSRIGVKDIGYMGNVPQAAWTGCPSSAERHIKVN